MKEVEISAKGLVFFVLKHCRNIIIGGLVGAIVLSGLMLIKASTASNTFQNGTSEISGKDLSDDQKALAESAYSSLNSLRQLNNDRGDSLLMSIDPNNAAHEEIIYMISVEEPDAIGGIVQVYGQILNGSELKGYVSEKTGLTYSDVADIVTVSNDLMGYVTTTSSLSIRIISTDETGASLVGAAIKEFVSNKNEQLQKDGFEHSLVLLSDNTYVGFDYDILDVQSKYRSEMLARSLAIIDNEKGLKEELKEYYNSLSGGEDTDLDVASSMDDSSKSLFHVLPKSIVLGLLLGSVIMCGLYFVNYITSNMIDEEDDIESIFGSTFLGKIPGNDYGHFFYKLRNLGKRTFNEEESIKLISARIGMTAQRENIKRLGIIGCGIKKNSDKAATALSEALIKLGIETEIIDDPLYDPSSMAKLEKINNVVILEKIGKTYRSEVWDEKELAVKLGLIVEGIVLVG